MLELPGQSTTALPRWYAAYVATGREEQTAQNLGQQKIETLWLHDRVKRRRVVRNRSRLEEVDVSLFPGYLFVNTAEFLRVEQTKGVISLVKTQGLPLPIPLRVVDLLRSVANDQGRVSTRDATRNSLYFQGKVDQRFTFRNDSPFHGLIGHISSLAKLDESGQIEAWVEIFNGRAPVVLHYKAVGELIPEAA